MSTSNLSRIDAKAAYLRLTDDATFATVLHILAHAACGEDLYELDVLEVFLRLEETFNARLTLNNENKLNAILTAVTTDAFHGDPEAFRAICNSLSEGDPGVGLMDDLTVPEILWGVYEVELNADAETFAPQVQTLIQSEMQAELGDPDVELDPTSYVFNSLQEQRTALAAQLQEIGLSGFDLPPVVPDLDPSL